MMIKENRTSKEPWAHFYKEDSCSAIALGRPFRRTPAGIDIIGDDSTVSVIAIGDLPGGQAMELDDSHNNDLDLM